MCHGLTIKKREEQIVTSMSNNKNLNKKNTNGCWTWDVSYNLFLTRFFKGRETRSPPDKSPPEAEKRVGLEVMKHKKWPLSFFLLLF